MANKALTADTTPTLDWADVSGANKYHAQLSLKANFGTITVEDNTLATSTYTPTALTTDNTKYYWRWRSSSDGGTTWGVWSDTYSFWLYSLFTTDITPASGTWRFIALTPLDNSDSYTLAVFPSYAIQSEQIMLASRRNLLGAMVSESVGVSKATISLGLTDAYMVNAMRNELLRFYNMNGGFYVVNSINNGTEDVENVYKVIVTSPIVFNQVTSHTDLFTTSLNLAEV